MLLAAAPIEKHGHEEGFAREQPLARAEDRAEESGVLLRAIAEDRFHFDPVLHVHHAAGFRDGGFHGIQFDLDELHVVPVNLVFNFVHRAHKRDR
jgi:hypothetical protein